MKEKAIIKACFLALFVAVFCYYLGTECAKKDLKYITGK